MNAKKYKYNVKNVIQIFTKKNLDHMIKYYVFIMDLAIN